MKNHKPLFYVLVWHEWFVLCLQGAPTTDNDAAVPTNDAVEPMQCSAALSPATDTARESVASSTPELVPPNPASCYAATPALHGPAVPAERALAKSPVRTPRRRRGDVETPPTLMAGLAGALDAQLAVHGVQASDEKSPALAMPSELDGDITPKLFTGMLQRDVDEAETGEGVGRMSGCDALVESAEVSLGMGLRAHRGPPGMAADLQPLEAPTPIMTWNPAFLQGGQSPAESMGEGTPCLRGVLDTATTPLLSRPRSAGACSSVDRAPCELREEASSAEVAISHNKLCGLSCPSACY
jgi:hypothetical protein